MHFYRRNDVFNLRKKVTGVKYMQLIMCKSYKNSRTASD